MGIDLIFNPFIVFFIIFPSSWYIILSVNSCSFFHSLILRSYHHLSFSDSLFLTILSFLASFYVCKEQECDSIEYNQYLTYVPQEYRVCDECSFELNCYHQYGKPFSFRTINNKNYPTIPYGSGMEYLCVPYMNPYSHYQLLILIASAASEIQERRILRERFSRFSFHSVRFLFVIASNTTMNGAVKKESIAYEDILQLNHIDSYHNLTLTTFGAFQFISHFSDIADYVMKTDSDCALNIKLILHTINYLSPKDVYFGNCQSSSYNTKKPAKNFVPPEVVGNETAVPDYVMGGGYVISSSIIGKMVAALRHLSFIAHNEDVNVGKAMKLIGVKCSYVPNWIALHGCENKEECMKYQIMHKDKSDDEVNVFWRYIIEDI